MPEKSGYLKQTVGISAAGRPESAAGYLAEVRKAEAVLMPGYFQSLKNIVGHVCDIDKPFFFFSLFGKLNQSVKAGKLHPFTEHKIKKDFIFQIVFYFFISCDCVLKRSKR